MNGFYRIAACSPFLRVADPAGNTDHILDCFRKVCAENAAVALFPELCITGKNCGDFFFTRALIAEAGKSLLRLRDATAGTSTALIVGLPLRAGHNIFNAAAVLAQGKILGFTLKSLLTNAEARVFSSGADFSGSEISFAGISVPAGTNLLFESAPTQETEPVRFGIDFGTELFSAIPPAQSLARGGATMLFSLAADAELAGMDEQRRMLLQTRSASLCAVCAYVGAGVHESTTDAVCAGAQLFSFNGKILAESPRFSRETAILFADVNPSWCEALRRHAPAFRSTPAPALRVLSVPALLPAPSLDHLPLRASPFVPEDPALRTARCEEILSLQAAALAKRAQHTGAKRLVLGISGGLDSTLALLVCARTADLLQKPRSFILAITMPGFGTSSRTKNNAVNLTRALGAQLRKIPITPAVSQHFKDIGHDPENHNVVYENAQARERTQILMDLANAENGLLVGTGDLSEIALGWSTFNGDHMSMYNVNCDIPKTLIRALTSHEAAHSTKKIARLLTDINETPISPELLPGVQKTEGILGRYELHDFFLYYFLKYGETPENLRALAAHAFGARASAEEIASALTLFFRRFVTQQFKRNAAPDGPQIGSVSLSARKDWVCPSDCSAALFPQS